MIASLMKMHPFIKGYEIATCSATLTYPMCLNCKARWLILVKNRPFHLSVQTQKVTDLCVIIIIWTSHSTVMLYFLQTYSKNILYQACSNKRHFRKCEVVHFLLAVQEYRDGNWKESSYDFLERKLLYCLASWLRFSTVL